MSKSFPDNPNNSNTQSIPNPSARSRRRLLGLLGASGGAALGVAMVDGWQKPVVEAALLPAHAGLTGAGCVLSIRVGSFNPGIDATAWQLNALVSDSNGTTALASASGNSGGTSIAGSSMFPAGNYTFGVQAFRSVTGGTNTMSVSWSGSCCNADAGGAVSDSSSFISSTAIAVIADDGTCSIAT